MIPDMIWVLRRWALVLTDRPSWWADENPYGDGKAAARVLDALERLLAHHR
jgi:hypothetical protein